LGSIGYATWSDTLSAEADLSNADYNVEIINCWIQQYNGQGCTLLWEKGTTEVSFTDEAIFPGWNLILYTQVHNKGQNESWVATVNYTIYYQDEQTLEWVQTNETELYDLFRISYTSGFFLNNGTDTIWNTPDDTPMPLDYEWIPCTMVFSRQELLFDAQDRPDLMGKTFNIKVVLTVTYPNVDLTEEL
jgi:hypothetical protein